MQRTSINALTKRAKPVSVYPSTMSESGEYVDDKSTLLFDGLPGEPVIVLCNLSDIYSNVLVTVSDGGEAIEVRPGLSGEDGRLVKEPGVYDFSTWFVKSSARLYGRKLPLEFSIPKICEDDGLIAP